MSSLPAEVTGALHQLLASLTAADNELRTQAEKSLNEEWIGGSNEHREMLLLGLAEQSVLGEPVSVSMSTSEASYGGRALPGRRRQQGTSTTNSSQLRSFAAVLFRRISMRQPEADTVSRMIDTISEPVLDRIKNILLEGFVSEQTGDVRHKISDAIAEIARPGLKAGAWPVLLQALFQASKNSNPQVRESSFRIFAAVPDLIGEGLIESVIPVFASGFDDESEKVRISTVIAFTSFFQGLSKSTWRNLHQLLPNLLNVLAPLRQEYKSDELASVLESLIDLAGLAPKMFKPVFKTVLDFCIDVAKDKNMDLNARLSALELATTFADEAPTMCKKEPTYADQMIVQCLAMMTEIGEDDDDAAEWNNEDDVVNSEDQDESYTAAKQSLDRLALKLGGKVMLPPLFHWLPNLIGSEEWRERHAALMAISNVAEGCSEEMMVELDKILDMVIPCLNDNHCRVQWATCNALGQMSTDFSDYVQKNFAGRILPALISKLGNNSTPRVQAHAAAALVNFSECASKEILDPYLDSLLSGLLVLLQSPKRYVQEQVLTTIAIVADAAENRFIKYYDTLIGLLFNVMKVDTGKEYRLLKAKSIECATLIALAVGKEKFLPQCEEMVQIFASIQETCTDDDDPCQSYLVHAWGRLCRVLGTDFLRYLPGVMPPLLEAAKHKPDLQLFEDEDDIEYLEQQEGWDIIPIQGKYIGIHTSLLDEKCNAIELISVYASELGESFAPYVKGIVEEIIVPSLNFFYHDGVRYASAQAVPHLLTCQQLALAAAGNNNKQDPSVLELWVPMLKKMLEVLKIDSMVETLTGFYSSIYQAVELIGEGALNPQDMMKLVEAINSTLKDYMERVKTRNSGEVDYEDDDGYTEDVEEGDAEDADQDLIGEINKVIHSMFKTAKHGFYPAFEQLLPIISTFINSNIVDIRQWALCAIDDLIEFTGPESFKYKDVFLPKLLEGIVDSDPTIRQAAVYGIGVAAQYGGDNYTQTVVGTLETLFRITSVPDARSEDNINATENASAAIAKILRKHGQLLGAENLNRAVSEWIKTLPIIADEEAAPFAYLFLSDLIEQNHPSVIQQVDQVFNSVSQAIVMASIQGKTLERVVQVTKHFFAQLPQPKVMELFQSLPVESQQVVQEKFQ